jgi:leucyl aminopeptidase (aminopeptidase T)
VIRRSEEALARVVLDRYLAVRPGETVTIETWDHALPWARAFVLEARRRRVDPALVVEDEEAFFRSLALSRGREVPGPSPTLAERSDAYVYLPGPEEFPRLFGLPTAEFETVIARHGPDWWRAARRRGLRAVRVAVAAATPTAAARFGVDLEAWRRDVLRASLVPPDRLARAAEPIARRLARARRVHLRHPNGTDLTVRLLPHAGVVEDGRLDRADRAAGRVWSRVPTGLAAFALADGSAEGIWEANRPVYDRYGDAPVAEGARFTFRRGRLREFSFERGASSFASAYARGGRGREVASALTFGLNPAVVRGPELDELARGTVGLLLGDNRAAGGRHRSRFSYLTTLSGVDIELDGRPWWSGGRPVAARKPFRSGGRPARARPGASSRPSPRRPSR